MKTFFLFIFTFAMSLAAVCCLRPSLKEDGVKTYYKQAYSGGSRVERPLLFNFSAESVFISDGAEAEEIIEKYRARVVYISEIDGIRSYYCKSPMLGRGVMMDGKRINLHIAVAEYGTSVGTPIIFGGY